MKFLGSKSFLPHSVASEMKVLEVGLWGQQLKLGTVNVLETSDQEGIFN